MRQLFHLQIKKVCCFSGEQILAMIVFYLILRTKTIIANSHQKYLINEKFDAFIGNYFDLSAFKLGFQNQQFIGTDL